MNRANLLGLSLLSLVSVSGCYAYDPGYGYYDEGLYYPTTPGDVSINWSFAGAHCVEAPEVQSVWVTIPGERLENDGVYPCQIRGTPGIVLRDFYPGDYSFSLEGIGYRGERLYVGSGVFTVDGSIHLSVDLVPYAGPGGYAYLTWSFPGGGESSSSNSRMLSSASTQSSQPSASCRELGVEQVQVRIDGGGTKSYPCLEGTLGQGAKTPVLGKGTHRIELAALGKGGDKIYGYSGELNVSDKETVSAAFSFR